MVPRSECHESVPRQRSRRGGELTQVCFEGQHNEEATHVVISGEGNAKTQKRRKLHARPLEATRWANIGNRVSQGTALTRVAKWALLVLIVDLVSWFAYFPAPYGLETRPISSTSLIFGIPFFLALLLNIAAIPILWRRPKIGSLLTLVLGI